MVPLIEKPGGKITQSEHDGITVFSLSGYFDEDLGHTLNERADHSLRNGKASLIIDFSQCAAVNSLGVEQLIELSVKVIQDFKGRLVFSQIKPIMQRVFDLAGITPQVDLVPNVTAGISLLKTS